MCPICLSAIAWLALGGGSAAGLGGLIVAFKLKGGGNGDDCCK